MPQNVTDRTGGKAFAEQFAADLRRKEFLRPEFLLPVTAVARRLGVCVATVHNAINQGKLRCHLFGAARRVKPEDLETYINAQSTLKPPAGEDWCTVGDLMRAAEVSRAQAYRLLERGEVPFQVFATVRYIRRVDIEAFVESGREAGVRNG